MPHASLLNAFMQNAQKNEDFINKNLIKNKWQQRKEKKSVEESTLREER